MSSAGRIQLHEVEQRVCEITSEQLGIPRERIWPHDRIIEDLHCDSLDLVELFMKIEETFDITLPTDAPNPVYKVVFTRQPFRLSDLAELVYLQQGTGKPDRKKWRQARQKPNPTALLPFTQLDGRWKHPDREKAGLFEPLPTKGNLAEYRRRSDGMRCIEIPAASVEIGSSSPDVQADEMPGHVAEIDAFLIDAELVSTTAYSRFLNSIGPVEPVLLTDWFVLDPR